MQSNLYCVIVAGGRGERLWPYSTSERPKQLIPFLSNKSLLEQTVDRCTLLTEHIWVVTTAEHAKPIQNIVGSTIEQILIEPVLRNTAPAVLYACLAIHRQDPCAQVVILPADHHIPDVVACTKSLQNALRFTATSDALCLLGKKPKHAATSYGYIEISEQPSQKITNIFPVQRFHEKPDAARAQHYVLDGNLYWNLGMVVGKVSSFLAEGRRHASQIVELLERYHETSDPLLYAQLPVISFDHAVLEHSTAIALLPIYFEWHDVGTIETFMKMKQQAQATSSVIEYEAHGNLVDVSHKKVFLAGVHDLCVIEIDDLLVIMPKGTSATTSFSELFYESAKSVKEHA